MALKQLIAGRGRASAIYSNICCSLKMDRQSHQS